MVYNMAFASIKLVLLEQYHLIIIGFLIPADYKTKD